MTDKTKQVVVETEETKDLAEESKFLRAVGGNLDKIDNGLSILKKIYNSQMEELIRRRIDEDFFNHIILADPSLKENLEARMRNKVSLSHKRKIISIIREKILSMIEWEKKNVK